MSPVAVPVASATAESRQDKGARERASRAEGDAGRLQSTGGGGAGGGGGGEGDGGAGTGQDVDDLLRGLGY